MFKSICARAIVPVALTVTGFVVLCCLLLYTAIKADMTSDAVQHSSHLADTIVKSTRYAMLKDDRETLSNIISNIGELSGVEHVRIFNKKGLVMFSENPGEVHQYVNKNSPGCFGCHAETVPSATLVDMQKARTFMNEEQVEVLAITAPIYNEPACFTASCHVHPAEQVVLGTLDIGLDMTPLERTFALLGSRMIIFSLMVLLLTVGGVAALLGRSVFQPIRKLTDFTDEAADGNLMDSFPEVGGELGKLAENFRKLILRHPGSVASQKRQPGSWPDQMAPFEPFPDDGLPPEGGNLPQSESADERATQNPTWRRDSGSGSPDAGNQGPDR
jgi:HAMP domain-containing protein